MSLILDASLEAYSRYADLKSQIEESKFILNPIEETCLQYEAGILKLSSKSTPNVFCDFLDKNFLKEIRQSFGRSEGVYSFLRSMSKEHKINICDLTVGMGKDFFKFILAGHNVSGFERNPVFYHLVSNGIERFKASEEQEALKKLFKVDDFKMSLKFGEAVPGEETYDLVYFDPMFEDKSKKAAPKKAMQALKCLSVDTGEVEKIDTLKLWMKKSDKVVYKCSGRSKDFPLGVSRELKGKGFSYLILS